jgi:2-dehydro-3-deoxyphosphogluconate aldolase/(4S)-4-hydroxy-2-oxoglutarate aldolase
MTRLRRTMRQILARTPVMPVLTVHDVTSAAQLAGALVRGGVFVFEVLLRTPQALDAVKAMIEAAPEADIGLGTLLEPSDVLAAVEAGVAFGVSPGLTPALAQAVRSAGLPFLPGTSSASEVMFAREHGFREMKLFPAQGAAGIPGCATWRLSFRMCSFVLPVASSLQTFLVIWRCPTVVRWAAPGSRRRPLFRRTTGRRFPLWPASRRQ